MKKYEGKSTRTVKTATGKIPDSFGFSGHGGGGVVRRLTLREQKLQLQLSNPPR